MVPTHRMAFCDFQFETLPDHEAMENFPKKNNMEIVECFCSSLLVVASVNVIK